jgi:hypothetical protein
VFLEIAERTARLSPLPLAGEVDARSAAGEVEAAIRRLRVRQDAERRPQLFLLKRRTTLPSPYPLPQAGEGKTGKRRGKK